MAIEYEESWKEKLTSIIPVYGGYKKRQRREETDKKVREKALLFIKHAKDAADQLISTLAQKDEPELLNTVEKLRSKIDVNKKKVETTKYGHSSVFETEEPSIDRLEKITEYDARIIVKSKRFQKHAEELVDKAINETIELREVQDLLRQIEVLKKDWQRRKDVIMGVEDIESQIEYP